jgi:hypothetical protein
VFNIGATAIGAAARTRKLHPIGKPNLIDIFLTKA